MPVAPTSSFPIPVAVDLDFRPDTYVADWCALAAIVQNVTGERRGAEALRAQRFGTRDSAVAGRCDAHPAGVGEPRHVVIGLVPHNRSIA